MCPAVKKEGFFNEVEGVDASQDCFVNGKNLSDISCTSNSVFKHVRQGFLKLGTYEIPRNSLVAEITDHPSSLLVSVTRLSVHHISLIFRLMIVLTSTFSYLEN